MDEKSREGRKHSDRLLRLLRTGGGRVGKSWKASRSFEPSMKSASGAAGGKEHDKRPRPLGPSGGVLRARLEMNLVEWGLGLRDGSETLGLNLS